MASAAHHGLLQFLLLFLEHRCEEILLAPTLVPTKWHFEKMQYQSLSHTCFGYLPQNAYKALKTHARGPGDSVGKKVSLRRPLLWKWLSYNNMSGPGISSVMKFVMCACHLLLVIY